MTILSKYLSRPRADNYDPEAILIGSIQKEKSMEHSGKQNTSDPRRRPSADRYRHRSSFSDRYNHPNRRFPKMFFQNILTNTNAKILIFTAGMCQMENVSPQNMIGKTQRKEI